MHYKVLASLKEDMNEGWIWITNPKVPSRSVVEVALVGSRKSIYCEALLIDKNYLNSYSSGQTYAVPTNEDCVTISSWYRRKLGIDETNQNYDLKIKPADHYIGKIMACFQHPQIIVRVATWLGLLSVALGAVGVSIAICA